MDAACGSWGLPVPSVFPHIALKKHVEGLDDSVALASSRHGISSSLNRFISNFIMIVILILLLIMM